MSSAPVDASLFSRNLPVSESPAAPDVIDKYPLVLIDQNIQIIQQTSVGTDNAPAVSQGLPISVPRGSKN